MYVDILTVPISIDMPGRLLGSIGTWKVMGRKFTLNSGLIFSAIGLHEPRVGRLL